jgi:hypothetical protein
MPWRYVVEWRYSSTDYLHTILRSEVMFTPWPLYLWRMRTWCRFNRRLGGFLSRSVRFGEDKKICLAVDESTTPSTWNLQPCLCSDYAIPAPVNKFKLEDSTLLGEDVVSFGGKEFKFIFRECDTTPKAAILNFVLPRCVTAYRDNEVSEIEKPNSQDCPSKQYRNTYHKLHDT